MHRLVCSGLARQEQTGRELLDAIALDVMLDFAYGEIVREASAEQRKEIDDKLAALDAPALAHTVEKVLSSGKVVRISEARLARIRKNQMGMRNIHKDRR